MPRPYTGNLPLHARLTPTGIAILERENVRRDLPSLSAVLEDALEGLLEETDSGRRGILILPTGKGITSRKYFLPPGLLERLEAMTEHAGFNLQQILRAAIAALDRDPTPPGPNKPATSPSAS